MVDLERYPLLEPSQPRYRDLVRQHQEELARTGVTTLPGLVTRLAINTAVQVGQISHFSQWEREREIYISSIRWFFMALG